MIDLVIKVTTPCSHHRLSRQLVSIRLHRHDNWVSEYSFSVRELSIGGQGSRRSEETQRMNTGR